MANDSSMLNIDMVDQFGKNIANVSAQTLEIFSRLGQQLQTVNSVWNDDNYDNYNPQNEMFAHFQTKRIISKNETQLFKVIPHTPKFQKKSPGFAGTKYI